MLIITRRPGERIMLGDDIVVHVMEIVGNSVRVGIDAPRSLPIYREEIWDAVREENRAAAQVAPGSLPAPAPPAASRRHRRPHGPLTDASPRPPQGGLAVSEVPRRVRSSRPTRPVGAHVMAIRMKVLLLGGAAVAAGAVAYLKRDRVAGLLPSRTQSPSAPPPPPAPSNYDAPGPVANTATPVPAPEPQIHPAGLDEQAEIDAAAAEAANIGGAPTEYAGPAGERATEEWRPLAEAGEGESEGLEQAEAELVENAILR